MEQAAVVIRVMKKVTLEKGLEMKELIAHMSGEKTMQAGGTPDAKGLKWKQTTSGMCKEAKATVPTVKDLIGGEAREVMGGQKGQILEPLRSREGLWPLREARSH